MGWILFASLTTIANITPQRHICRAYSNISHESPATQIKKANEIDRNTNFLFTAKADAERA
jgi:hypothetical protein